MPIETIILVAISLSLDAFSLSLLYGTLNLRSSIIKKISITVGIFHFLMPLLGYFFGDFLSLFLFFSSSLLIGIIFVILSIQMFLSIFKEDNIENFSGFLSYFLFGLTVSVDSFSVGIGLGNMNIDIIFPCIIFSFVSFIFTYLGLLFGNKMKKIFGKISTLLGSIILLILGIYYIF